MAGLNCGGGRSEAVDRAVSLPGLPGQRGSEASSTEARVLEGRAPRLPVLSEPVFTLLIVTWRVLGGGQGKGRDLAPRQGP